MHANEIMLLAYYIAAVNIESTYHAIVGKEAAAEYVPFEGIVLADTFQISEEGDSLDAVIFPQNNDRIIRQNTVPINVVVGNPPYSKGQTSANDLNANRGYPTLDGRIATTYAKRSTATNKNSLYDSYLRALRWATDRIGDAGVVAFVSNGGWIDGNTADGVRLSLADEYAQLYVYNLRGNQRAAGELSRKEGGKVFGSGSRNTVAILIGVKNSNHSGACEIFYRDIGDYLTREEKLRIVADSALTSTNWKTIVPNAHGDWTNQRNDEFEIWPVIGEKQPEPGRAVVFSLHSSGLKSNRDTWVYNFSEAAVEANVKRMLDFYNVQVELLDAHCSAHAVADRKGVAEQFIDTDPTKISWSGGLRASFAASKRFEYEPASLTVGLYRPFSKQYVYYNAALNERRYQLASMFPTPHHSNIGFYVVGTGSDKPFSALMTNSIPDLSFWGSGSGQFFPRWTYVRTESSDGELDFASDATVDVDEYGYRQIDNITDGILALYRCAVGDQVTKDDIFYYVYGLLYDPAYREAYVADLKKMLPHIPTPGTRERFEQLATAGRELSDLHVGYESVEPYDLDVQLKPGASDDDRETWRASKMKWGKKKDPETGRSVDDRTTIIYNPKITIAGIPEDAERYMLGSRSALAWIIYRYQVDTDKASGIVNDPNDWCDEHDDPAYIVDLIMRVTTVAVETMKIVDSLG
ncbi:type ISP restriction/modification enzyme [Nocardia mangyaensis]|uniref:type ISP restriction/modification enzyme n=1 Tax=Nocardia mangyaensis TaxID=2213200 RepID=UPI003F58C6F5